MNPFANFDLNWLSGVYFPRAQISHLPDSGHVARLNHWINFHAIMTQIARFHATRMLFGVRTMDDVI